jgi:hypothetical protein
MPGTPLTPTTPTPRIKREIENDEDFDFSDIDEEGEEVDGQASKGIDLLKYYNSVVNNEEATSGSSAAGTGTGETVTEAVVQPRPHLPPPPPAMHSGFIRLTAELFLQYTHDLSDTEGITGEEIHSIQQAEEDRFIKKFLTTQVSCVYPCTVLLSV